jgi:hypothetical protein
VTNTLLAWVSALNAAIFLFGTVQHAGLALGPFREPRILPAALVETIYGLALAYAAVALFGRSVAARRLALISNLVALAGVIIGLVALAVGAGPRTASNDLYHRRCCQVVRSIRRLALKEHVTTMDGRFGDLTQ